MGFAAGAVLGLAIALRRGNAEVAG